MRNLITVIFILAVGGLYGADTIIPSERKIDWAGTTGVRGGIPERTTIYTNLYEAGADKTGVTNASSVLSAVLAVCPSNQVVYVPAGTYNVGTTVDLRTGNGWWTLRGDGPAVTEFVMSADISHYGGSIGRQVVSWDAGHDEGDTNITIRETLTSLDVGEWLVLDEINDTTLVQTYGHELNNGVSARLGTNPNGPSGDPATYRNQNFIVKVESITNNTNLTVWPPLPWGVSTNRTPEAVLFHNAQKEGYGFDGIKFNITNYTGNFGFDIQFSPNVFFTNCLIVGSRRAAIRFYWSPNWTVTDCAIVDSALAASSTSYGVETFAGHRGRFVNNIASNIVTAMMFGNATHGCVVAYNYIPEVKNNPGNGWMYGGIYTHYVHTRACLIEGNYVNSIIFDAIHGSGSHHTVFRNRVLGWDPDNATVDPDDDSEAAINIQGTNWYYSVVGNILGWDARHDVYQWAEPMDQSLNEQAVFSLGYWANGRVTSPWDSEVTNTLVRTVNYDYVTDGVLIDTDYSTNLVDSLYLDAKPTWFGSATWPPVDPWTATYNQLPAELRASGDTNYLLGAGATYTNRASLRGRVTIRGRTKL